jgi:hypothetical protein
MHLELVGVLGMDVKHKKSVILITKVRWEKAKVSRTRRLC